MGLKPTFPRTYTEFSNIKVAIKIDLILTGTEKENTDKDTMTQETIAEDTTTIIITIMTVLGPEDKIADEMKEMTSPPPPHTTTTKSLHVETNL